MWAGNRPHRLLPRDILGELDYHNCRGPYDVEIVVGVNRYGDGD